MTRLRVNGLTATLVFLAAAVLVHTALREARGQVVADPPIIVRADVETLGYVPGGARIVIPAGTEIDACAIGTSAVLRFDHDSRVQHVLAACPERAPKCPVDSLFCDDFED